MNEKDTSAGAGAGRGNRPSDSGNFGWFSKAALRIINEEIGTTAEIASARAIYFTLCQMASDAHSDTFVATIPTIGGLAGYCDRTTGQRLASLEQLGLLRIARPPIKQAATYTLLRVGSGFHGNPGSGAAVGIKCASIGNKCGSIGNPVLEPRISAVDKEEEEEAKESKEPVKTSPAELIFKAYPRWDSRELSLAAISKALKVIEAEHLIAAIRRYRKFVELKGIEQRFIPTAATFFREERWKEYLPTSPFNDESIVVPISQKLEDFLCALNSCHERGVPEAANLAILFYEKLSPDEISRLTPDQQTQFSGVQLKFNRKELPVPSSMQAAGMET